MTPRLSRHERGYNSKWVRAREYFLADNPLCRLCWERNKVTPSTVVDHIKPHKGDQDKFWDESNWQALCKHCHDSHKQAQEKSGKLRGCDENGYPFGDW